MKDMAYQLTPQEVVKSTLAQDSPNQRITNALALLGKGNKSVREMRTLIVGLEAAMAQIPGHKTAEDFKTTHHFSPGIYMRELFIPKDTILTGKIHKTEHLNILSQGDLTVWTEEGMKRLTASTVIKSQPGIKRVGYSHEDTTWITVHYNPSDERDIKKVEARLFSDSFDEAYLTSARTFEDAITFLGFTREEVTALSENKNDQIDFIAKPDCIEIRDSAIHGKGVFSTCFIKAGETIAPARVRAMRTPAGRYCNHGASPNSALLMRENGDVDLVALMAIEPNVEILNDYYVDYKNTRILLEGR